MRTVIIVEAHGFRLEFCVNDSLRHPINGLTVLAENVCHAIRTDFRDEASDESFTLPEAVRGY